MQSDGEAHRAVYSMEAAMTDRELIEWVAGAKSGDALPAPYRDAGGMHGVIMRLVELGVMTEPTPGESSESFCRRASAAAAQWLERS